MKVPTRKQGESGEQLAREYLEANGYHVRECNWRLGKCEIDLIAEYQEYIVFVEVKFRETADFGDPELFVSRKQQARIIKGANEYILDRDIEKEARFDIIAITGPAEQAQIRHLERAFFPVAT